MLIINDSGTDVCNLENVFSLSLGQMQDGTTALVAYGAGLNLMLAAVGDRPTRALEAVVNGIKQNWKLCDLNDLLGPRPNLAIAKAIVGKNGEKLVG